GHAEEALAAYSPVAGEAVDPVLVAGTHVRRVPAQLTPARDQRVAVLDRANEPLARGDDLDGALALLVELDGAIDALRLADQVSALLEQLDDARARAVDRRPLEFAVGDVRTLRIDALPPRRPP